MELKEKEPKKGKRESRLSFFILIMMVIIFLGGIKLDNYLREQTEQKLLSEEHQKKIEKQQQNEERKKERLKKSLEREKEILNKEPNNIEPNSTEMVEYITAKASQDANNIIAESEQFNNAFQFIVDNYPNYFGNNEIMEKTMYFSKLAQYVCQPRWDFLKERKMQKSLTNEEWYKLDITKWTSIAVSKVYVNKETVDSELTQGALKVVGAKLNVIYPDEIFWKAPEQENKQTVDTPKEMMVWIPTNGGTKYHLDASCSDMINPEYVTENQAKARGFTPCKKCF